MSDENKQQAAPTGLQAGPTPVTIHTQYVRDISFENPNAPDSLRSGQANPNMEVNIGMDARILPDTTMKNLYEVIITLSASAVRDGKGVFVAEVIYAAVVSIDEIVPEDQHHPILLIEVPRHIFPYARHVLSDITSLGGYPPLLLNPVDFHALYVERFKNELKASMDEEGQETVGTA